MHSLVAIEWFLNNKMDKHYLHTPENYCGLVYQSVIISGKPSGFKTGKSLNFHCI